MQDLKFSSRIPQPHTNRITQTLQALRRRGVDLIDLTQSNPTQAGLPYPWLEIQQALASASCSRYEPDPRGLPSARRAVAEYYRSRGRPAPDPGDIVLTASTSEAYSLLFKLLLDPAEEILAPAPGYPLLEWLGAAEGVRVAHYPSYLLNDSWCPDLRALEARISQQTRAVVLVHPNNPTGCYVKRGEWEELKGICLARGLAVICDEVFYDYSWREDSAAERFDPLSEVEAPLFILNGLSKTAGLPQLKLAWIVAQGDASFKSSLFPRLDCLADAYLSVNTPVQRAAPALLQLSVRIRKSIRQRLAANRSLLEGLLRGSPARLLPSEGGWYAILELPQIRSEEDWALGLLKRDHLVVHPGYFYDFPDGCHLVISLLGEEDRFRKGCLRMAQSIDRSSRKAASAVGQE